jgi:hypothetical protein
MGRSNQVRRYQVKVTEAGRDGVAVKRFFLLRAARRRIPILGYNVMED